MSDQTTCIRCSRAIDAWARICPYCNQDQSRPIEAETLVGAGAPYVPPAETKLRKYVLMAVGGVAMVVLMFAIGFTILNHKNSLAKEPKPTEDAPEVAAVAPQQQPTTGVTLVPTNEAPTSTDGFETPITSAPAANAAENVPTEYQRTDATAVASGEYAQMAAQAKAEKQRRMNALVDPRSLTGAAYSQGAPPAMPKPMMSSSAEPPPVRRVPSTRPVPEYQPVPRIRVSENVTARLDLTIGADGRVKEVNLRDSIPGESAKLIAAVQSWRFKPATENGQPVAAPFSVDISFHANE
ncbi:MAG: TonB family protein [Acidobacteria bacterium]|nr:TonB family protein [Acidobacteriota bacterium]